MDFQSERLTFREFETKDYDLFSSVYSNGQIMRYAYMDQINSEEEMIEYFNNVLKNNKDEKKRSIYELAVFLKKERFFIGIAVILMGYHISKVKHGEIGYFLLPQFWGKGYATEISKTLTGICFRELKVHKVAASCNVNNTSSENIMKKIGMIKEGELRKERYKDGGWHNELRYGILKEEWKEYC